MPHNSIAACAGDRVVNERLHTLLRKKRLQLVALLAEYGKLVVHIVGIGQTLGQRDERIADVAVVKVGQLLAAGIVVVKIFEFDAQHGSVHLAHAAVDARIFEHIFAFAAVVGQGANGGGKFRIVGCDGPSIAHGPDVLPG